MRRYGKQQKVDDKATVDIKKGSAKKGAQKLTGDDGYKAMDRSKECRVRLFVSPLYVHERYVWSQIY